MTTTPLTLTELAAAGINITDFTTFTTMTSGSGNGVTFAYSNNTIVFLKNDTGASRVYTVLVRTVDLLTAIGVSTPTKTYTVADGKTLMIPLDTAYNIDGIVTIECDGAGKIAAFS